MSINYSWSFPEVTVVYNQNDMINVVSVSYWKLTATDNGTTVSSYGSVGLGSPNPASFTPFESITQQQLQEWTEQALGSDFVTKTKEALEKQIREKQNPTQGNTQPPWV